MVLAGIILAEAAVIYDGMKAVQTQSYGPEARGGASKSEVIISTDEIAYPKCEKVDILLSMNQKSLDEYIVDVRSNGTVLVDEGLVGEVPEGDYQIFRIPFTQIARDKISKTVVANIVAVGALVGLTEVVKADAIIKAVLDRVPAGTEELNQKAVLAGIEAGREKSKKLYK